MCTVTVVPHEAGIRLMCNRDERRTRPAAIPPRVHELGGRRAAFPVDPQGGGSWVGVNDAGIAAVLLNLYSTPWRCPGGPTRSRGLIVREILGCESLPRVLEMIAGLDGREFEAFQVVVVRGSTAAIGTHTGDCTVTCRQVVLDAPLLFTSSSLGDALVEGPRRRLFQRIVTRDRAAWLDGQAQFHRHRWRRRADISVLMEREDALTVSRTVVDVTPAGQVVRYEAPVGGPPSRERLSWCFLH